MDVLSEWLGQLVANATRSLPYAGHYEYSVVACNKVAQTVSARSLSPAMPDLTDVPIASPGLVLELVPGTQIRIAFAGADPTRPYVASYASGGLAPLVPGSGSGVLNQIDAGYVLISQTPAFIIAAAYFPAGVAGGIAAEAARALAVSSGSTAFLLHLNGGRILPSAWTVP